MVARTTIDLGIQRAAEEAVEYHLRQYGKEFRVKEGAVVVLETDGSVRAIVGGRDYGASQFNRATRALRQVGSSFKPYVYAAAMQCTGLKPEFGRLRRTGRLGRLVAAELRPQLSPAGSRSPTRWRARSTRCRCGLPRTISASSRSSN